MQGNETKTRPPQLSVDLETPDRPRTPYSATPGSAIITVPSDWEVDSNSSRDWNNRLSMASQPMSASSSSSSHNPIFSWPTATAHGETSSSLPLFVPRDRLDSSDSNPSEEDQFQPSSSSSSDDELLGHPPHQLFNQSNPFLPPITDRRGSVVFIPQQLRTTTDPHLSLPPELEHGGNVTGAQDGFDFEDSGPPRFTRTYSAPLPNRVGALRHPHSPFAVDTVPQRPSPLPHQSSSGTSTSTEIVTPLSTLSHELADSLQAAIQTLLHLSPPHLLDNAKEQYSGCTIQMPATSLTALLTSMRSLNYLSANVQGLCEALTGNKEDGLLSAPINRRTEDFDIGELVQNVADLLGGQAAQAGVDLVLFHGDVGIKHVSVNGDGEGLGYLLGHIIRQILLVAKKGDIIEIGLQLVPQSPSLTPKVTLPLTAANVDKTRQEGEKTLGETLSPMISTGGPEGPMLCIFEVIHNVAQAVESTTATPRAEINPFARLAEEKEAATPKLDTILCRRLLDQQRASLKKDTQPSSPLGSDMIRKAYELSVLLPRGLPLVEPVKLSEEEEAIRQPFIGVRLAREPTLTELSEFAESLRQKKVFLHASLGSLFARHLTSYLGAWGLDVSHIPIEEDEPLPTNPRHDSGYATTAGSPTNDMTNGLQSLSLGPKDTDKFIIIDDDVTVLRRELLKMCADTTLLKPRLSKRPTLGSRAKSTPALRPAVTTRPKTPVLIHFTSLAKYNQVRDIIASVFGPQWSARDGAFYHPEVMVIPKPVGPRRFLTALHTAVNQPMVDPTFSPIATTPRSPGGGYFWTGGRTPLGNEGPRDGFFDSVAEEMGEGSASGSQKARSPLVEFPPSNNEQRSQLGQEVVATPATEYFSAVTRTSSAASGIIVHSPDGRFGIHFEPPVRGERRASYSQRAPAEGRKPASRRASGVLPEPASSTASPTTSPQSTRRQSAMTNTSDGSGGVSRRTSVRDREGESKERRRKTLPGGGEPLVLQGRQRSSTITQRNKPANPLAPLATPPINATPAAPPKKKAKEEVVVPPINVLIVEDNPINQNILSMFLRKKKIKHQAAKDGEEAIAKWRTGGFHLILMDIQLPKMDGIQATKIIRDEEKNNNIGVYPSTPLGEPQKTLANGQNVASALRSSVIIVALTASSLHSDRVAALGAGCNDFLTKPVSLKWLEKKIVEWGCMQALIDFDGWRRWKGSDAREGDTKQGFAIGPQAAAKSVAERLKIERKAGKSPARQSSQSSTTTSLDINVHAPTPPLHPADKEATSSPAESLSVARSNLNTAQDTTVEPTHPDVADSGLTKTPRPLEHIAEKS